MANSQRPTVNQQLYFCRLHIDWLSQELDKDILPKAIVEGALGKSTILQLQATYRCYLKEIGEAYNAPDNNYQSAQHLIEVLKGLGLESSEASELFDLESNDWLHELIGFRQHAIVTASKQSLPRVDYIAVIQNEVELITSLNSCKNIFHALSQLIENQRTRLEEW